MLGTKKTTWESWFAWRPVKTWPCGEWVWLKTITLHYNEFGQRCYLNERRGW